MRHWIRRRSLLVAVTTAIAIALSLGAAERGAADSIWGCAPKPLCVEVSDQAFAKHSTSTTPRYMSDSVKLYNGGKSNLVNITLTVEWNDLIGGSPTLRPLAYEEALSDARCTQEPGTSRLTCTAPKSLSPGASETYVLVFGTATNVSVTDTVVTATATAKEQTKPTKKGGNPEPNDAVISRSNPTPYETSPDQDASAAGGGVSLTLATATVGGGNQFSVLPVPASPTATAPPGVYELVESNECLPGFTCLPGSQLVTTTTPAGTTPVNLRITYTGPIPAGTTESSIVVFHDKSSTDAVDPPITTTCNTPLFSNPVQVPATIPCKIVKITRGTTPRIEVEAWDTDNGKWGFG